MNVFAFIRMNGDQIIPLFQLLVVALCLDLWNAETDQTADETAGRCSDGRATKRRHNGTGSDQGADPGNCQSANSRQQSDYAASSAARSCPVVAPSGAFVALT